MIISLNLTQRLLCFCLVNMSCLELWSFVQVQGHYKKKRAPINFLKRNTLVIIFQFLARGIICEPAHSTSSLNTGTLIKQKACKVDEYYTNKIYKLFKKMRDKNM